MVLLAIVLPTLASFAWSRPALAAEDPVAVLITGPLAAKVGERVTFEVEIVNRSGRPLEKLRIVDYFDKGFHHDASTSPIEQKGTVDLAAGTSRRLALDFLLDEPGRQCHRVEILDPSHTFVGGATACVQVAPAAPAAAPRAAPDLLPPAATAPPAVPAPVAVAPLATAAIAATPATPSLELDLIGPAEVNSGAVAEYVATVRNTGSVPSGPTTLEYTWDGSFTPLEASDGYTLGTSRVSWNLPAIEPGGQLRRQINLRAQAPASSFRDSPPGRSCVRGVLSGLVGGVMVADEACVLVRSTTPRPRTPREAGLRLSLADLDDPVRAGGTTTLVCTVANDGSAAAQATSGRLDLVVVLPDQGRLVGDPIPSRVRIDGSSITFDSIPGIPPGGQATFELVYRMPAGGSGRARAILTGAELDGSLEASSATTFLSP
ncbi:MAG: DUF11 domain-containing protein [Planctomycetia bacterium]|nr:DUF11 domain-containing protein [Planctomycetia bacterium]